MTQEEAVIGGFCGSREMVAYADTENTAQVTAAAWAAGKGTLSGAKYYISVFDQDLKRTDYREVIKGSSDGRYGVHDAHLENLSLSPDGSQVFYQAKVEQDVYDFDSNGNQGDLLFSQGLYSVTLDLATGEQTYTRAELPSA
mgnify:FL=1